MKSNFCFGTAVVWALVLAPLTVQAAEVQRADREGVNEFRRRLDQTLGKEIKGEVNTFLHRVIHAYPEEIRGVRADRKAVTVVMRNGESVVFEDFNRKNYEDRIERPDVADMLFDPYPPQVTFKEWPENLDPGRYRNDAFLKAVYGATPEAVESNLVSVPFVGTTVRFNRRNGAADALSRVGAELDALRKANPKRFDPYLKKMGGTFLWRKIAGTERLSAHSYGISVDLNPDLGGYWQWEKGKPLSDMARRIDYPAEIVAAFERQGFVWGGKWYYFDLMHFEYRPELLNDQGRRIPVPPVSITQATPQNVPPAPPTSPQVTEKPPMVAVPVPSPEGPGKPETAPQSVARITDRFETAPTVAGERYRVQVQELSPPDWVISKIDAEGQASEVYRAKSLAGLAARRDLSIPPPALMEIEAGFLTSERARIAASGGSVPQFDRDHFEAPIKASSDPEIRAFYDSLWRRQPNADPGALPPNPAPPLPAPKADLPPATPPPSEKGPAPEVPGPPGKRTFRPLQP